MALFEFCRALQLVGFSVSFIVAVAILVAPLATVNTHGDRIFGNGHNGGSNELIGRGGVGMTKQLLLIIDMQNDYDLTFNMKEYGYQKCLRATEMRSVANQIELLIEHVDWNLIAFSQDWLAPVLTSTGALHQFCLPSTPGADPLPELLDAADRKTKHQLRYTKNVRDVFNTLKTNPVLDQCMNTLLNPCPLPPHYPDRCFDSNDTYNGKILLDVLADRGFTPQNTKITVTGTKADRSVMASTLHALSNGFAVDVYEPGVSGGWDGPKQWCDIPIAGSTTPLPDNWQELVIQCAGHAGREAALGYMKQAGARILWQLPSLRALGGWAR